jgi:hypothetical protein
MPSGHGQENRRLAPDQPTSTRMRAPDPHRRRLVPSLTPAVVTSRGRRETNQDRVFGPTDDREMFPVRRGDGRRFVELPGVAVKH